MSVLFPKLPDGMAVLNNLREFVAPTDRLSVIEFQHVCGRPLGRYWAWWEDVFELMFLTQPYASDGRNVIRLRRPVPSSHRWCREEEHDGVSYYVWNCGCGSRIKRRRDRLGEVSVENGHEDLPPGLQYGVVSPGLQSGRVILSP